jgi:hypothetical protein
MAVMMGNLYLALRAAKVPEDQARGAAEEIAAFDTLISDLRSKVTLLQWMVGFNLAMTVAIIGKLFLNH